MRMDLSVVSSPLMDAVPDVVLTHALTFLSSADAVRCAACDRRFRGHAAQPALWSALAQASFGRGLRSLRYAWRSSLGDVVVDASGASLDRAVRGASAYDAARPLNAGLWAHAARFWPATVEPGAAPNRRWSAVVSRLYSDPGRADPVAGIAVVAYPRAAHGSGRDVCVRGDVPFDLKGAGANGVVRGTFVVPRARGWAVARGAYFEVELRPDASAPAILGQTPTVSIGMATATFRLAGKQPGWDRHSFGYHGDDGHVFHGSGTSGMPFGPTFGAGDVVGCGVCGTGYGYDCIYFVLNGRLLGAPCFREPTHYFPVLGLDSASILCVVNFGQAAPFRFTGQARIEAIAHAAEDQLGFNDATCDWIGEDRRATRDGGRACAKLKFET